MTQLQFETTIQATPERVWEILWNKHTYAIWTAIFAPECYYTSNWKQGEDISFMGPEGNGIFAIIHKMEAPKHISFQHLGMVKNHQKVTDEAPWKDMFEAYTLDIVGDNTVLKVTLNSIEDYKTFFESTFPQALQVTKDLAENKLPIPIKISTIINAPIQKVWDSYTTPSHIVHWNHASDDWHTTAASVDLKVGGKHSGTMAAKDGSMSFEFWGIYTNIEQHKILASQLGDGRNMSTTFQKTDDGILLTQIFDAENENPLNLQEQGWQAILNNFKKHTESI